MKHSIKIVMGSAFMLALPLLLTSCEDVLGHWEKPTPVIPAPLGSIENPYSISTSADWDAFAAKVNGGETNIHAKQTGDISGVTTVIGTEANPFKGTYDGQGFKISDINITGENHLGLFGYVSSPDAVIQNVVVASGTVTGAGQSYGAIVGTLHEGKVDHCVNYADISSSYSIAAGAGARIGGIVGWMYGDKVAVNTVIYCINFGSVTASGTNGCYAGGIVGCMGVNDYGLGDRLEYCQNYGDISTKYGPGIGGIVGWLYADGNDPFTLKNNHNGGNLTNTANASNNVIWGGSNLTGANVVDPSNTYLSSMTLTLGGAAQTPSTYAHGATEASNPEGITIGSKTYTKE
jgi:hypothetical protein